MHRVVSVYWVCVAAVYTGVCSEKLLVAFPVSSRANASQLGDGPTNGQGWAHYLQWWHLWDNRKEWRKKKKKPCTIAAREHMGENILRETVLQILRSLKREW